MAKNYDNYSISFAKGQMPRIVRMAKRLSKKVGATVSVSQTVRETMENALNVHELKYVINPEKRNDS
jgi:hypothetical protein